MIWSLMFLKDFKCFWFKISFSMPCLGMDLLFFGIYYSFCWGCCASWICDMRSHKLLFLTDCFWPVCSFLAFLWDANVSIPYSVIYFFPHLSTSIFLLLFSHISVWLFFFRPIFQLTNHLLNMSKLFEKFLILVTTFLSSRISILILFLCFPVLW